MSASEGGALRTTGHTQEHDNDFMFYRLFLITPVLENWTDSIQRCEVHTGYLLLLPLTYHNNVI